MNFTIGGNVTGLSIGIVNNEVSSSQECANVSQKMISFDCVHEKVSCRFINLIDETFALTVSILETNY